MSQVCIRIPFWDPTKGGRGYDYLPLPIQGVTREASFANEDDDGRFADFVAEPIVGRKNGPMKRRPVDIEAIDAKAERDRLRVNAYNKSRTCKPRPPRPKKVRARRPRKDPEQVRLKRNAYMKAYMHRKTMERIAAL